VPAGTAFFLDVHVCLDRAHLPLAAAFRAGLRRLAEKGNRPGTAARPSSSASNGSDSEGPRTRTGLRPLARSGPGARAARGAPLRHRHRVEERGRNWPSRPRVFPSSSPPARPPQHPARALWPGPLAIDFRAMGERAPPSACAARPAPGERTERRSGGAPATCIPWAAFTGEAEYAGELAEFLPWLRAARWVGVGRQTPCGGRATFG